MKLQLDQKYYKKEHVFPNENIPQSRKSGPEYFLRCANAIVAKFVQNKTAIPYDYGESQDSIAVMRSYLYGNNSPDKYKDILIGKPEGNTGKRKTTMNISWRVPQILPEKMDVVRGYMMKLSYDIVTSAIDMQAKFDKETIAANLKLMIDDRFRLIGVQVNEAAGREVIPPDPNAEQAIPFQNEQQVDIFANNGGILLEQEASIKTLLDQSILESDWEGIMDKLTDDLCSWALCGTKTYYDAGSEIPKIRYVDISRAIIPYSQFNDYRDITYGGEIRQMTIAEIRAESGLSEKELMEIARMYSSDEKSPQYIRDFYYQASQGYSANDTFGMNLIDSLVVDVADLNWVGTCTDTLLKYNHRKGANRVIEKKTDDYIPSKARVKEGAEVDKNTRQCIYKAKLIVGTDHVFDFGLTYNQTYYKDSNGKLNIIFPYRFCRTGSSSLVSRAIGFVDDLALATYKKRNALKKLPPPPNVFIEQSAFENVEIGGNKMNPKAIMKLYQDEGYMIGSTQNLWGQNTVGRNPITVIPSGVTEQIMLYNSEIEFNIQQIERVTGINEIFSGATPTRDTGLGVSQIAINATMNAIYPLQKARETIFEQTMRVCAKGWQVSAMAMDEPGRKPQLYDRALRYLKAGGGRTFNEFMIKIEAGATDDEKQMLLQDIRDLQNMRRQSGVGGIRPSDYLMLFEMIKAGKVKQARLVLAQIEEHLQQMDDARNRENQQMNIESQLASNQQTAENEMELKAAEEKLQGQREAQNIQLKLRSDLILQKQKAEDERRNLALQNIYQSRQDRQREKQQ